MMRLGWTMPLCLMLVACQSHEEASSPTVSPPASAATAAAPGQHDAANQAGWQGFGDMRFGMDEAAFRKAWSGDLKGGAEPGSDCALFAPTWAGTPAELSFMLEHGRFVRYDVRSDKETAPGGGKVGMSQAQVMSMYAIRGSDWRYDKYDAGTGQFRVEGKDKAVLIFRIGADGKVTAWRLGVPPQIDYVEGCS